MSLRQDMLGMTLTRLLTIDWQLCAYLAIASMRLADMPAVERKDVIRQAVLSGARQEQARVHNGQRCLL